MSTRTPLKSIFLNLVLLTVTIGGLGVTGLAYAAGGNNECPVGLVKGLSLNDEFGPGASDLTRCLDRRHNVKVVMQINQFCRDAVKNADCTRAYALGNIQNMINDYEITHGMRRGVDYKIVAVVHSGGGGLVLKDEGYDKEGKPVSGRNQFQGAVENLISEGVEFYFCQNTTRGFIGKFLPAVGVTTGGPTAELIPGVKYTTAGVTSIAEFQQRGYEYVQP